MQKRLRAWAPIARSSGTAPPPPPGACASAARMGEGTLAVGVQVSSSDCPGAHGRQRADRPRAASSYAPRRRRHRGRPGRRPAATVEAGVRYSRHAGRALQAPGSLDEDGLTTIAASWGARSGSTTSTISDRHAPPSARHSSRRTRSCNTTRATARERAQARARAARGLPRSRPEPSPERARLIGDVGPGEHGVGAGLDQLELSRELANVGARTTKPPRRVERNSVRHTR